MTPRQLFDLLVLNALVTRDLERACQNTRITRKRRKNHNRIRLGKEKEKRRGEETRISGKGKKRESEER